MHAPSGRLDVRRVSGVERTEPRRTATGLGTLCVCEQSARRAWQRPKPAVAISSMGAERCGRPMQMRPTCASRVGASRGAYRLPGDDQRNARRAGQRPRPAAATSRMVQDWRTHRACPDEQVQCVLCGRSARDQASWVGAHLVPEKRLPPTRGISPAASHAGRRQCAHGPCDRNRCQHVGRLRCRNGRVVRRVLYRIAAGIIRSRCKLKPLERAPGVLHEPTVPCRTK